MDSTRKPRRGSETGMIPVQVVGFHVEGATPSPDVHSHLAGVVAGSPTPVIIPPNFQREPSVNQRANAEANTSLRPAESQPAPSAAQANTSVGGTASAPLPEGKQSVTSAPRPIQMPPGRGDLAHASIPRVASMQDSISEASPMSSVASGLFSMDATTRATPPPSHHSGVPSVSSAGVPPQPTAAAAAAPSASAGPASAAAAQHPPPKSGKSMKEMSKQERRELQEAQRAAKAAAKGDGAQAPKVSMSGMQSDGGGKAAPVKVVAADKAAKDPKPVKGGDAAAAGPSAPAPPASAAAAPPREKNKGQKVVSLNSTELFAHLQQYKKTTVQSLLQTEAAKNIHPAVVQLGLRYADGSICGANARCMAMLHAFCQVIRDYNTPDGKELNRDLLIHLNATVKFLVECRPLSVGMGNVIRMLKLLISKIPASTPDAEAKEQLVEEIENYISGRIINADKQLVKLATSKVDNGDVILTYAASYCVTCALIDAAKAGKRFKVVVMNSRPENEGKITLQKLLGAGIPCTYVHLNASSYIIREVTKVFLGAAAVLSNGTVLSRAGSAAVAMMAHAHSVPVMICCETHKFNERVQLDSITHNELGDPEALAHMPGKADDHCLQGWQQHPRLRLLNLKYDAMPAEYVTMIVTEFGMIPPTSVPVIIREFRVEPGAGGVAF